LVNRVGGGEMVSVVGRVPVIFARNGYPRPVVRRDTWDDLLIRDVDRQQAGSTA
jgi:hypothetical protein